MLGLPDGITACLFDLDGVLTKTAVLHERAWKVMFDEFLGDRGTFEQSDYNDYVDGKPREDGIRDFLASRGIEISDDELQTLSERKNDLVLKLIHDEGVKPYPGSVRYVHAVRDAGLHRAVVSSSANTTDVLNAAGIHDLFETQVDGHTVEREHLNGKPAPDTYLRAAKELGVEAAKAAVFEDALSGVAAGRAGNFGFVVGVDRVGQADALKEHGADVVVKDLADLLDPS